MENQEQADKRIPELLKSRELAPVLGLSCEPLLGPVDLIDPMSKYLLSLHGITTQTKIVSMTGPSPIDWVICGGESGDNVRPMHPDWARSLRDQCKAHGVPFFFKQWGEYCSEDAFPGFSGPVAKRPWNDDMTVVFHVGKKLAGRLLDGVEWNEFPQRMEAW